MSIILVVGILTITTKQLQSAEICTELNIVQSSNKDEALFNIIGVLPISVDHPSELYPDGVMWAEMMHFMVGEYNNKHGRQLLSYTMYDICSYSDISVTTEAVMDIMSNHDSTMYNITRDVCPCDVKSSNSPLDTTLGIVGPIWSSKTMHVNKLLHYRRLPMISYGATSPELSDSVKYPNLFRTILPDGFQAEAMESFLLSMNWTYISILHSDDTYGREGAHSLNKALKLCVYVQFEISLTMKEEQLEYAMNQLKQNTKANVVLVWAHLDHVKKIFTAAANYSLDNKTWITSESSGRNSWFVSLENQLEGTIIVVTPNAGNYKKFEDYFYNLSYDNAQGHPWVRKMFHTFKINSTRGNTRTLREFSKQFEPQWSGYFYNAVESYLRAFEEFIHNKTICDLSNATCPLPPLPNHKEFGSKYIQRVNYRGLLNETISFNTNGDVRNGAFSYHIVSKNEQEFPTIGYWVSATGFTLQQDAISTLNETQSKCSEDCERGFSPVFSRAVKKCCWKCAECEANHVKPYPGLQPCTRCNTSQAPDPDRTRCIPFSVSKLRYHTTEGYTIIALSTTGLIFTLFTMITFVVARNTKIVRTVNLYPSLLQLFVHLLLFLLPYLFLDSDTKPKCITRTFGVGILFSLIIGITLAKVTHIKNLFLMKHRINAKERRRMATIEIAIMLSALLIEIFLMVVLMQVRPIEIKEKRNTKTFVTVYYCHVTLHLAGQLVLIVFLQLICCVQAFNARKLPNVFNETKYITFAMFSSVLVMVLTIPLYETYENQQDRNFVISVAVLIANYLIFLILYLYKLVLIWIYVKDNGLTSVAPVGRNTINLSIVSGPTLDRGRTKK